MSGAEYLEFLEETKTQDIKEKDENTVYSGVDSSKPKFTPLNLSAYGGRKSEWQEQTGGADEDYFFAQFGAGDTDLIAGNADELVLEHFNNWNPKEGYTDDEVDTAVADYNAALESLENFEEGSNMDEEYARLLLLEKKVINQASAESAVEYSSDAARIGNPASGSGWKNTDEYGLPNVIEGRDPFYGVNTEHVYKDYSEDIRLTDSERASYSTFNNAQTKLESALAEHNISLPQALFNPNTGSVGMSQNTTAEGGSLGAFGYYSWGPGSSGTAYYQINELAKTDPVIKDLLNKYNTARGDLGTFTSAVKEIYVEDVNEYTELYTKFYGAANQSGTQQDAETTSDYREWNKNYSAVNDAGAVLLNMFSSD